MAFLFKSSFDILLHLQYAVCLLVPMLQSDWLREVFPRDSVYSNSGRVQLTRPLWSLPCIHKPNSFEIASIVMGGTRPLWLLLSDLLKDGHNCDNLVSYILLTAALYISTTTAKFFLGY